MKLRLQRYVLREVAMVLGLAVAGVAGVILLAMCVRLLQEGLKPMQLRGVLPYLVPFALPFAAPCGILIATVMTFGRLAGDNELLAIRSSGLSLWPVVWPVLLLGGAMVAGAYFLNNDILPWCQQQVEARRERMIGEYIGALNSSEEQGLDLPPYVVYVRAIERGAPRPWRGVMAVQYAGDFVAQIITADRGACVFDEKTRTATLTLTDGQLLRPLDEKQQTRVEFPGDVRYTIDLSKPRRSREGRLSQMSLLELLRRHGELRRGLTGERRVARPRVARRELDSQLGTVSAEVDRLSQALRGHSGELTRLEEAARELTSRQARLAESRKNADEEATLRAKELQLVESNLAELRRASAAAPAQSDRRRELEAQIQELARRRWALRKDLDGLQAKSQQDQAQLAAVEKQLADNGKQRDELTRKRVEVEKELDRRNKERGELYRRRAVLESQQKLAGTAAQIHFRLAQSVACLVFALLGIPLGILSGRGGVMVSFGIAFAVVLCLYYPVYTFGKQLTESGYLPALVGMWLPNLVCGVPGAALLLRTARR